MKRCCFWTDLRLGVVAAGMFAMTTSWTQIIAEVALWWQALWVTTTDPGNLLYSYIAVDGADPPQWPSGLATSLPLDPNKVYEPFSNENTSLGLFAAMTAMDGLLLIFSFILLVGVQIGYGGRGLVLSWLIFMPLHMAYEIAFVIMWYMYFGMAHVKLLFATPIILMFIYSVLKFAMNAGGLVVAAAYYHQLHREFRSRYSDSSDQLTHNQQQTNGGGSGGGFYDAYGRK